MLLFTNQRKWIQSWINARVSQRTPRASLSMVQPEKIGKNLFLGRGGTNPHYAGSSVGFRASRWSSHKNCMFRGDGKDCSFCEHWALYHKNNLQDLSCIEIYVLDSCEDPGPAQEDYPILRKLEEKWIINMGSLAALDPIQGWNKRDDARAKAWQRGGGS